MGRGGDVGGDCDVAEGVDAVREELPRANLRKATTRKFIECQGAPPRTSVDFSQELNLYGKRARSDRLFHGFLRFSLARNDRFPYEHWKYHNFALRTSFQAIFDALASSQRA